MLESNEQNVIAVVVTYEPELNAVGHLLNVLSEQVNSVVMVDNGSKFDLEGWNSGRGLRSVNLIGLGKNCGIAKAHNIGIEWAKNRGAQFVLLMDQDSIPAINMVEKLLSAISTLEAEGKAVACVGPFYTDPRNATHSPFVRMERMKSRRIPCSSSTPLIPVDFVISSGCLIPMKVLNAVGGMLDVLFIDYVDVEWGMRARRDGYQSYGVFDAKMEHNLGNEPIRFFGLVFSSHSPLRNYYIFRNRVYLLKQPWVGKLWLVTEVRLLLLRFVFFSFISSSRLAHIKMMSLGVWHSLCGRMGKYK
ncbi:MAG: rhamnosyltransferase [Solimicrobium sp.]|jgi:rhamnosyltransferase|nr:rhamnosyltransferase [Solimicrobium sp.]